MKHKNTQPIYIFNRENLQNSEPQNGPRSGLDCIALELIVGSRYQMEYLLANRDWSPEFETGLNISCPFAKTIPLGVHYFDKRTAWSP